MSNIITHAIAALPLYELGFRNGCDVGLVTALNLIVAKQARQDDAATAATDPHSVAA